MQVAMMTRLLISARSRFLYPVIGASVAFLAVICAWLAVPVFATEAHTPRIESISWGTGSVGAEVNPEGLETAYEIVLECEDVPSCESSYPRSTRGHIAASYESQKIKLLLTELPPGSYGFYVVVINSAGSDYQRATMTVTAPPPGGCLNGCSNDEPEKTEIPSWIAEVNEREEAQVLRELEAIQRQAAKEHDEQEHAREEARRRNELPTPMCVVPSLKGDTLSLARRALKKANCQLGKVVRSSRRRGVLRVVSQNPERGSRLEPGAPIAIVCRPKPRIHRHR
jgi:PASTA domain